MEPKGEERESGDWRLLHNTGNSKMRESVSFSGEINKFLPGKANQCKRCRRMPVIIVGVRAGQSLHNQLKSDQVNFLKN